MIRTPRRGPSEDFRDFTLDAYGRLVEAVQDVGYEILPMEQFVEAAPPRGAVLRHDVDRRPERAVDMARLENRLGAQATYYFRAVPESWDIEAVREIASLGHEIGYHYEDLTLAGGDVDKAITLYREHLAQFREVYPVRTICMHGSPRSPWDNRDIWTHIDYRTDGVTAEPYFDIDFEETLYATDTGRAWNDRKVSRRDHVDSPHERPFASTDELAEWVRGGRAPRHVMISTHPERWTNSWTGWAREKAVQLLKRPLKTAYIAVANR